MSMRARAHVEEHFSDMSIARKHAELYDDVATNCDAAAKRPGPEGGHRNDARDGTPPLGDNQRLACFGDAIQERQACRFEG